MRYRAWTTGHSLIEISCVVSVLGIVAAIAAPRYANSLAHYRVDAAANRVAADLALIRTTAKYTSSSLTVNFNTTTGSYSAAGMKSPMGGSSPNYTVSLTAEPYLLSAITSAGFGSTTLTTSLTFDRYSTPSAGGAVVVGAGGYYKTITVDPNTGLTSIAVGNSPATASSSGNSNQTGNSQN